MNATWQIEVEPLPHVADAAGRKVEAHLPWLGIEEPLSVRTRRIFLVTGALDEVQVSGQRRSPDWIRLSRETQKPGAAVLEFGK